MDRRKGFTLIELLVVIAIIALLMSILMPALARVRKQAKNAICMSNLKQWGTIFAMYTGKHDGYFMGGWGTAGDPWNKVSEAWLHALRPYFGKQGGLTCCPMATKPLFEPGAGGSTFRAWGVFGETQWYGKGDYGSYGISSTVYDIPTQPGEKPDTSYWRNADVRGVNNIPVFLDALWIDGWVWHGVEPPEYEDMPWNTAGSMGHYCLNRHNGGVNCLFMDWSVRKVGLKELYKLKWNRHFNINGPWTIAGGVTQNDWPEWLKKFKDY